MSKRNFLWILFCFGALSSTISAQRILSLEDARNLAIQNNKHLKMATEEEKVAYYEKKEAFLKYFPKFSGTGFYIRNEKNLNVIGSSAIPSSITLPDLSGLGVPIPPGTQIPIPSELSDKIRSLGEIDIKNIWVGSVSMTQPLFMGGRIVAYNDIMKNAQELAKSKKDTELQDVIAELDASYWQIVSLAYKKELAESYLKLLQKMHSDISIMESEGVATKADVLSVKVKENEADMTLTKVENGLSLARMLFNQLCGLEIEDKVSLVDEKREILIAKEAPVNPSIEEALINRPEIRSLELATKIYKGKEKIERAEFLPEVGLVAAYLWTNPNGFDGLQNKFGGMWNVGVKLSVPLNFMTSSAKLSAAKAQTRIQEYQLEEAKEKIELQINQSAFKLNEAHKRYVSSEQNMEKANENLRYANVGFEEGVIPASDVLSAQTAWLSAHSEMIDSQIDVKLCNVYLNKALGRNLNDIK
uniref:TolC family protein n=1 Tax=uncultured Dysgonomonas sp. TaxID=206096 RepID=UPI00261A950D|nr:TolC family protein [uncultured Dysgonomonas sp.]